jgi:hypothetical protein
MRGYDGLNWQATATAFISDGRTESPLHTVAILEVLDEARRQIETQ